MNTHKIDAAAGRAVLPALGETTAGLQLPDSALVREAVELAWSVSPPLLFNHVMRTYFFGRLLESRDDLADPEVVALSAVLHDLGLTEHARGPRRFEIEGADAARRFLQDKEMSPDRSWLVWDTIALHPLGDVNLHKEPEARIVQLGIVADAVGVGIDSLDPKAVAEVISRYPRCGFKTGFFQLLVSEAQAKPDTHVIHPVHMAAHHCGYCVPIPDARALLDAAPFAE
jgi:HD domain